MQTEPLVQRQGAVRRGDSEPSLLERIRPGDVRHSLAPVPLAVVQDRGEEKRQEEIERPNSQRQERLLDLTEEENRATIHQVVGRDLTGDGGEKAPVEAHYQHGEGPGGSSSELQVMQDPRKLMQILEDVRDRRTPSTTFYRRGR